MFIELPLASWLALILIHRIRKVAPQQRHPSQFLAALAIFILLQFGYFIIPQKFHETKVESQNPVQVGEKQYNFSDKVQINDRNSAKMNLAIEGNKVVWVEQVKSYPDFPENIWDVFLFEFNPQQGKGNTVQVSNFEKAKNKSPEAGSRSVGLFNDQVYWVQDNTLYTYNVATKKPELIANNVSVIYGKHKNSVLIRQASSDDLSLYLLDLGSKRLTKLPFQDFYNNYDAYLNSPYLCYFSKSNKVGRFNIETGENITFDPNFNGRSVGFYPKITDCQTDFITYAQSTYPGPGNPGNLEYKVYQVSKSKYVLEKTLDNGNFNYANAKVQNNKLYFTGGDFNNTPVVSVDLTTGKETSITQSVSTWDISGEYLVYGLKGSEFYGLTKEIFLQKLPQ